MRAAVLGIVGLCWCAGWATVASAQAGKPAAAPKKAAAPAAQPAAAPPQAPAAAAPAPSEAPPAGAPASPAGPAAPAAPVTEGAPPTPGPAASPSVGPTPPVAPQPTPFGPPPNAPPPAPPTYGPQNPPPEPPPAPYYERLGKPEPEIQKGDWDPWEHATPEQRNHEGFYLRLALGFGGGSLWGNHHILPGVSSVTLSGLDFGTSLAIGGTVSDNLILDADFFQATMFRPSIRQDGHEPDRELGVGHDVTVAGFGIGLTYYIMPANVYVAGAIGLGQAVFESSRGDRSGSDLGLATNVMIGKEWWVGSDWGIGVAGQLILLAAHDEILGGTGSAIANVLFSATYN